MAEAVADDLKANPPPPPPPSDPRDTAPHPFEDPQFTPAGLVEGILKKYLTAKWYFFVVVALWVVLSHVYPLFRVAPRVGLTGGSGSGKTTARKVIYKLVHRPNPESSSTGAAIREFLDGGPCTILLDEIDHLDAEARRVLQNIWNLGHERGEKMSLVVAGKRKLVDLHAPMLAAGVGIVGTFLAPTQKNRTFVFEMEESTEETEPEREIDDDVEDLDAVYSFLRHWAERVRTGKVKLNLKPTMPGALRRFRDNVRGLLAIADSCGPEWGQRAREALTFMLAKEKAEQPKLVLLRHGLVIFEALGVGMIRSTRFNKEVKQLDLPDARWTRYRGPSGNDYAHPIAMFEQAALLAEVGIHSVRIRPPGERQCHGYKLEQFQEAQRKYGVAVPDETEVGRARLRLVKPSSD